MNEVPPKNDESISFGRGEGKRLFINTLLRAIPIALSSQVVYILAYCYNLMSFEKDFLSEYCGLAVEYPQQRWAWMSIFRCEALSMHYGTAATSSGSLMILELVMCSIVLSASFVHGTEPIWSANICTSSPVWVISSVISLSIVVLYLLFTVKVEMMSGLPWYFYLSMILLPLLSLVWSEFIKRIEKKHEKRAKLLRRLQFETKLGMYSPKL